jgi:hypothetical protein
MTRGVLWMTWGTNPTVAGSLARSRASVKHWHPELPQHVAEMPADSTLLCKSRMYELSPFDVTLFLDADTTVLGRLDYGFAMAERYGMALTHSANPWQRRYDRLECEHADEVEWSSGVVFFDKECQIVDDLFAWWNHINNLDSSCNAGANGRQAHNDQALLTRAIHDARFNPFTLPCNWNLHPTWQKQFFGEVKIWHGTADIPASLLKWNDEQSRPGAVIRCATLA